MPKPPKFDPSNPPKVDLPKPPKLELPKVELPKPPKVELPKPTKLDLPEIKFPSSKEKQATKPPKPKPSKVEPSQKKKENDFVLTELSLQQFREKKLKESEEGTEKKAKVEQTLKGAKPQATISLFGFGRETSPAVVRPPKQAPKGVPIITNWRENRDGSISGFISGSPSFEDGDAITTSPIFNGDIKVNSVVQTGSGSRLVK